MASAEPGRGRGRAPGRFMSRNAFRHHRKRRDESRVAIPLVPVIVTLAALAVVLSATAVRPAVAASFGVSRVPLLVAHRGGAETAAEGSLPSFLDSAKQGFPLEMDLRTLADGRIAISHDATTGESTENSSDTHVSSLTASQWRGMCLTWDDTWRGTWSGLTDGLWTGSWASEDCWHPTTLGSVLDALDERGEDPTLVVENKQDEVTLTRLERILSTRGLKGRTLIESLDFGEIAAAEKSGFRTMYVMHKGEKVDVDSIAKAGTDVLAVSSFYPTSLLARTRKAGVSLWVWTVDRPFMALRWARTGVDGIITDHPRAMRMMLAIDFAELHHAGWDLLPLDALSLQAEPTITRATGRKRASPARRTANGGR